MTLNNLSVSKKLILLMFLSIFILIIVNCFYFFSYSKSIKKERVAKLTSQVDSARSLVQYYVGQTHVLGEKEAKRLAAKAVEHLRYDGDNYFWILSDDGKMVMHATSPDLDNEPVNHLTDPTGKPFFSEMLSVANKKGQGFVQYFWDTAEGEQEKLAYVVTIDEFHWVLGSGVYVSDIHRAIRNIAVYGAVIFSLAVLFLVIVSRLISHNIVKPLNLLKEKLYLISGGDMSVQLNLNQKDEMGIIADELDRMTDKLRSVIVAANSTAQQSSQMADHMATLTEQSSVNINSQRVQLEQLSAAMTEMTSTISDVASRSAEAADSTQKVSRQALLSGEEMGNIAQQTEHDLQVIQTASELVGKLELGVNEISEMATMISSISEQTNLLALNAAIEAARAGEQGRGFSVVADEVRNLANRTQESTLQIQQTIESLISNAKHSTEAMQTIRSAVNQTQERTAYQRIQAQEMMNEINLTSDMVIQIASAAEQQDITTAEVNANVNHVSVSVHEINSASTDLAQQSQALASISQALSQQLAFFNV